MITVDATADRAVIHADGELDEAGGALLCQAVGGLAVERQRVELNLSGITAADVAGVRALDAVRAATEAAGAELLIHHEDRIAYPIDWHWVPHSTGLGTIEERH
jgi:anti-anti-sigma regulatory factor